MTGAVGIPALQGATLAPPCPTAPLSVYLVSGFSCSVGILNFGNFHFSAGGTSPALLNATLIRVTPVPKGLFGGGFSFSAIGEVAFIVGPNQTANYTIDFLEVIV